MIVPVVFHPEVPTKRVRTCTPTLDQLNLETAVLDAVAKRDKQWAEAVAQAGGSVVK